MCSSDLPTTAHPSLAAATQSRQERVDALLKDIDSAVASTRLSRAVAQLDEAEELAPSHPGLARAYKKIAGAYLQRA